MALIDVLSADRILVGERFESKEELLSALVGLIASDPACAVNTSQDVLLQTVLDRENRLSTGIQEGIAIPHGMIDEAIDTYGALAILPGGLDFSCMDGLPAQFITLLVFSDTAEGRSQHVALLAETVGFFADETMRGSLLLSHDPSEVWTLLTEAHEAG